MKFDIVAPVTKPTPLAAGSPSRSSSHADAMSSSAEQVGVTSRSPAFWSHALTNQSAASPAGWVPPTTKPKNRPDGIAVSPASPARAIRSMVSPGGHGPGGRSGPNAATRSSIDAWGGTGLRFRVANH